MSGKNLTKAIIEACEDYQSIETIAGIVNRSARYLKNKIIPGMVRENLIERLYPDSPTHRDQKYKAIK